MRVMTEERQSRNFVELVAVLWYPKMTIGCVSLPVKLMWAEAQTPAKLETTNPQAPPNPKEKGKREQKRRKPEEREECHSSPKPLFHLQTARLIRRTTNKH